MPKSGWDCLQCLLLLGVVACGNENSGQPVSKAVFPLQATVSAAFDIEPAPATLAAVPTNGSLACGSQRCLAAYSLRIGTLGEQVFAARVGAGPTLQDTPRIHLPSINDVWGSAARDDEFLVCGSVSPTSDSPVFVRVRGSDGALLPDVTERLPKPKFLYDGNGRSGTSRIAATKRSWLFAVNQSFGEFQLSLFDADFQPIGAPVTLSIDGMRFEDIIPGDGQYLLTWSSGSAVRISESDGRLLDPSPIRFSRYDNTTGARGIYKDGIYQLVWPRYSSLWGSRIRASDGASLDPDDTVNAVSGAKLLCLNRVDSDLIDVDLAPDSTPIVTWTYTTGHYAAPIDLTLGTRPGNDTTLPASPWSPSRNDFEMHWLPGGGLLRENPAGSLSEVQGATLSQSPFELRLGAKAAIPVLSPPRLYPAVASNGSSFLVAYSVDGIVNASWLDPVTGSYRGSPSLLGAGTTPAVGAIGADYLVVWITGNTLHRARMSLDGTVTNLTDTTIATATYVAPTSVQLTSNAQLYLATFEGTVNGRTELLAQRGEADGSLLDAQPIVLTSPSMLSNYRYRVTATDSSSPHDGTFLVFAGTYGDQVQRFSYGTGTMLDPPTEYTETSGSEPAVATDGSRVLALYHVSHSSPGGYLRGVFVDPTLGTAVPSSDVALFPIPQTVAASVAWYDGRSFSTILAKRAAGAPTAFYLQRFDDKLDRLDSMASDWGTPIASPTYEPSSLAVATSGSGRSLVVYQDNDASRFGVVIKGRFIDNDGLSSAGAAGNGSAGQSSVGSASGAGGTASGGAPLAVAGATSFSPDGTAGTATTSGPSTGGLSNGGTSGLATGGMHSGGSSGTGAISGGTPGIGGSSAGTSALGGGAGSGPTNAAGGNSWSAGGSTSTGTVSAGSGVPANAGASNTNVNGGAGELVGTVLPQAGDSSGGTSSSGSAGSTAEDDPAGGAAIGGSHGMSRATDSENHGASVEGSGCNCRVSNDTPRLPGFPALALAVVWGLSRRCRQVRKRS